MFMSGYRGGAQKHVEVFGWSFRIQAYIVIVSNENAKGCPGSLLSDQRDGHR
jgi:hypothetical protein